MNKKKKRCLSGRGSVCLMCIQTVTISRPIHDRSEQDDPFATSTSSAYEVRQSRSCNDAGERSHFTYSGWNSPSPSLFEPIMEGSWQAESRGSSCHADLRSWFVQCCCCAVFLLMCCHTKSRHRLASTGCLSSISAIYVSGALAISRVNRPRRSAVTVSRTTYLTFAPLGHSLLVGCRASRRRCCLIKQTSLPSL